jgi:hypothetical protein
MKCSIVGLHNKLLRKFKNGLYCSNTAHVSYEVQTDHHVFKNNSLHVVTSKCYEIWNSLTSVLKNLSQTNKKYMSM